MDHTKVWIVVLGMGFVTALCRLAPFAVLGRIPLPAAWVAWMRYVPIAILSAAVCPQLLLTPSESVWGPVSAPLLAALPTVAVGLLTRNLLVSVLIGVSSMALLRSTVI